MDSPGNLPPTATQNHHDEHLKSKPCAKKTNTHNQPKEYPALVTKVTASNLTKNNPQKQISEQVTEENNKNDNGNNNTDPIISNNNDKNTVYNRRIEHITIVTVINNRFTTKYTLNIRPEKLNSVINSTKIRQQIFEVIKNMEESAAIIIHYNTRITNGNTFPIDKEHINVFPTKEHVI